MVNTSEKGRKNERFARDYYESCGFETTSMPRTKWGENDFFGIADFLAVCKDKKPCLVQVKTNVASKKAEYEKKARELIPFDFLEFDLVVVHDGKSGVYGSKALRIFRMKKQENGEYEFEKVRDNR